MELAAKSEQAQTTHEEQRVKATLDERASQVSCVSRTCVVCGEATQECCRCRSVAYCRQECQNKHWHDGHKDVCELAELQAMARVELPKEEVNPENAALVEILAEQVLRDNQLAQRVRSPGLLWLPLDTQTDSPASDIIRMFAESD